jgi:hypothetical protein
VADLVRTAGLRLRRVNGDCVPSGRQDDQAAFRTVFQTNVAVVMDGVRG